MTHKTGWSTDDDELWQYLEDQRVETGADGIRSRSEVITELLRLGMAARQTLDEAPWDVPAGDVERRTTQQALRDRIRREAEE